MTQPRALHIAPIMPARAGNGLAMRQGMFLEALARDFDTQLIVLPVAGPADTPPDLPTELGVPTTVIPVAGRADTHFALLSRLADPAARLAAFRAYGRSSLAAHISAAVLADLRQLIAATQYDLVHIGRSYLADARQLFPATPLTLDLDEDERLSFAETAAQRRPTDPHAAAWAEAEGEAMSALITRSAPDFARHFISSGFDAAEIAARHPGLAPELIENAVALPPARPPRGDTPSALFVGSYGYAPNVDAITWFADEIWPTVRSQSPVRLSIVGRDAARLTHLASRDGIDLVGEVADIATAYAAATLVVAPLRSGAGTRLKLLEAAAHAVPIVTTSLGDRGLPFAHGRDLLVADDPPAFAAAVLETLADPAAARLRAAAARTIVAQRYDRAIAIDRLACRFRTIAAR
jgi:glycosyltransferase involved in cell wall biosynthesis